MSIMARVGIRPVVKGVGVGPRVGEGMRVGVRVGVRGEGMRVGVRVGVRGLGVGVGVRVEVRGVGVEVGECMGVVLEMGEGMGVKEGGVEEIDDFEQLLHALRSIYWTTIEDDVLDIVGRLTRRNTSEDSSAIPCRQ